MSGRYGWKNPNPGQGGKVDQTFTDARQAHKSPGQVPVAGTNRVVDISPGASQVVQQAAPQVDTHRGQQRKLTQFAQVLGPRVIPEAKHTLTSSAANVIICVMDVTGSLGTWPAEIFKRLPLLWDDAVAFFNSTDVEVLFIAYGDARKGDRYPLQVTRFGREQELDSLLAAIEIEGGGGGNGRESAELAAYYVAERVDTSTARNVSCFFITDEKGYDEVAAQDVDRVIGAELNDRVAQTKALFRVLLRKMRTFAILINSRSYNHAEIQEWWHRMLPERVSELDDPKRATDVIMGILARVIGKSELFNSRLLARQGGTQYGKQNIATVQRSILMVPAADQRSRLKLPAPAPDSAVGKDDWVD